MAAQKSPELYSTRVVHPYSSQFRLLFNLSVLEGVLYGMKRRNQSKK